jgi:hypothetical protein
MALATPSCPTTMTMTLSMDPARLPPDAGIVFSASQHKYSQIREPTYNTVRNQVASKSRFINIAYVTHTVWNQVQYEASKSVRRFKNIAYVTHTVRRNHSSSIEERVCSKTLHTMMYVTHTTMMSIILHNSEPKKASPKHSRITNRLYGNNGNSKW